MATRRCSPAVCAPCCCSRCIRWQWRLSRRTPATAATRGGGCAGPATSWRSRRTARSRTRRRRSPACRGCTSASAGPVRTGSSTELRTRICSSGSTWPSWTASSPPTRRTAFSRSTPRSRTCTSRTPHSWPASSVWSTLRPPWSSYVRCWPSIGRSSAARPRHARLRASCSSTRRCRGPLVRRTAYSRPPRSDCCRGGPAGRCGSRTCRWPSGPSFARPAKASPAPSGGP